VQVFQPLTIIACCAAAVACSNAPETPSVTPPGGSETITGSERIGWDQRAGDAVELAAITYVVYVDGARRPLTDVACSASASAAGFPCTARLPAMSAGAHTLQLASVVNDGGPLESARSAPLTVTVAAQSTGQLRLPDEPARRAPGITPASIVTADGTRLRLELVADGLHEPADLAFTPDDRLLIAERAGTVRMLPRQPRGADASNATAASALSLDEPGMDVTLVALAVDPQFARSRFVYVLYTAPARSGEPAFTLARFRESAGTLADRAILLDGVAAAPQPAGALRFGSDGTLYAAFDDGGDPRRRNDRASLNGKVIRLNPDGTTPRDQAGATPVYAEGFAAPVGLDWDPRGETMWVADRAATSTMRAVVADGAARPGERRGRVATSYALPRTTVPTSIAAYRGPLIPTFAGSVLVASNEGRHILRITGDRAEPLIQDRAGGIRTVAVAPDGTIYFANASAVGRVVPF
jgi:glucose/arabinose dehydrogenase